MTTKREVKGIADIGVAFEQFCKQLAEDRHADIDGINIYRSGFEGWLKFEFLFHLANTYNLAPCKEVGVERSLPLRWPGKHKRCDIWVVDAGGLRYHYIELKAFFNNSNESKMRGQARSDLWHMVNIDANDQKTSVATGSVIVVGVGFAQQNWSKTDPAVQALEVEGPQHISISKRSGSLNAVIHWNVWTRSYTRTEGAPALAPATAI